MTTAPGAVTRAVRGPRVGSADRRLLAAWTVRRSVAASVLLGMASAAAVVVQALALATILAQEMAGSSGLPLAALAWLGGAAVARGLCLLSGEVVAGRSAEAAKADLRRRLLGAVLQQAPSGVPPIAEVATVAGRGLDALDTYVGRYLPNLVLAVLVPLGLAAVIGGLDWVSGVVVLVVLALFPLFAILVGEASGALARERWAQVEALGGRILDVFEGLAVLKAYGRSRHQRGEIARAGEQLRLASISTLRVAFLSALVLETLASVSVALLAVPLGLRLLNGSVRLSTALAVLVVAPEVFLPLRRASSEFHDSTEGLAAVERAESLMRGWGATPVSPGGPAEGRAPAPWAGVHPAPDPALCQVALRQVVVRHRDRRAAVLAAAELTLEPGQTVVLLGANGAGKSTALRLLAGLATPESGTVTVGGRDVRELDPASWRRRLGYLPERPAVIADTLAANLRLAAPTASDDQLYQALHEVGAGRLLAALPQGLGTLVGAGGRPLSAGERQLLALARVGLRPASLYLLDEPTVHLDDESEETIVAALRRQLAQRTALIVTHRPAVARLGHRVMTLERGRFRELEGPWAAMVAQLAGELP